MLKEYLSTLANEFRSILGTTDKINAQDFQKKIKNVYSYGCQLGLDIGLAEGKVDGVIEGKLLGKLELLRDSKYMNAKVSGTAIAVNDVSPIEHLVACSVSGKNLFNPNEYVIDTYVGGMIDTNTDGTVDIAYDGSVSLNGGFSTGITITYSFTTTEECVLSLTGIDSQTDVYYDNQHIGTVEANSLEHQITVGTHTLRLVQGSQTTNTIYIQLEKGTTPTPYTPYLANLSSVEVSKYGKNLIDDTLKSCTSPNIFFGTTNIFTKSTTLQAGTYTLSAKVKDSVGGTTYLYVLDAENKFAILHQTAQNKLSFHLSETKTVNFKVFNTNFTSVDDLEYAQLEVGTTATAYKPYIEPTTYQATTDGTVDRIKSISPNMTLLTNNNDIVINAYYLRDIDTYIDNLITDVALTGGE